MDEHLKQAFDQVRAERELKEYTKRFLAGRIAGRRRGRLRVLLPAAACLLLILAGGRWFYFTPTAELTIDINPSLQLGINRFDQVVSVEGKNEDGTQLAQTLEVRYLDYDQALEQILQNEQVDELLSGGGVMAIGVVGPEGEQTTRLLAGVEACTAERKGAYCYYANQEEMEEAGELGLSWGKYQAFLALQALDPSVTPQEVRDMSMWEIRDRLEELSGAQGAGAGAGRGHGRHAGGWGRGIPQN